MEQEPAGGPGVTRQDGARGEQGRAEPLPPGQDPRREADHGQDPLDDATAQQLLPADVVVQRGGGHAEAPGQIAHRPRLEPRVARGLEGDVDNRLGGEADVVGPAGPGSGHRLLSGSACPPRPPSAGARNQCYQRRVSIEN